MLNLFRSTIFFIPPSNASRSIFSIRQVNILRHEYWEMERPPPSKIKLKPPPREKGHFQYERYWSRDSRYKPQVPADNLAGYIHSFHDHYEVRVVWAIIAICTIGGIICGIYTMFKIDIWADRSQKTPPWDWSRIRQNYWKYPTFIYDPRGITHQRLDMMEKLEDELMEAAKQKGTRNQMGEWKKRGLN